MLLLLLTVIMRFFITTNVACDPLMVVGIFSSYFIIISLLMTDLHHSILCIITQTVTNSLFHTLTRLNTHSDKWTFSLDLYKVKKKKK